MNIFKSCKIIKRSGLFDPEYYLKTYADIRKADVDPLKHFCKHGYKEGRNPSAIFDIKKYISKHPELKGSDINPLIHYIENGTELNFSSSKSSKIGRIITLATSAIEDPSLLKKFVSEVKRKGLKSAINKSKFLAQKRLSIHNNKSYTKSTEILYPDRRLHIIPHYINPDPASHSHLEPTKSKIAIHIDVTNIDKIEPILSRIDSTITYDLYITHTKDIDISDIEKSLGNSSIKKSIQHSGIGDMEAMLLLSTDISEYDIVGHFHTDISDEFERLLDIIIDNTSSTMQLHTILTYLQKDINAIYPESISKEIKDPSGWYDNKIVAKEITDSVNISIKIDDIVSIDYPKSGLFWAKVDAIKDILSIKISDSSSDKNRALRQLIPIVASSIDGDIYRLHRGNSIDDYRYYEEQIDYSQDIVNDDIKVLSYYLPQFHPIPENDEWHGKGFTEWTKVRGANPLFEGHYKQHIPHKDIGYYLLDSADTLRKQSEMMKSAGVHGQIFYHYWFSGKLILEEPVKMLLDTPDIDMPFCFCWANENWTRRWDGDDADVLLGQIYSREDAKAFIEYLIPFFKDSRYIRIDNRPVLYIYRPTSIPDIKEYLEIWESVCTEASIPKPYVVSVLTRGATDPNEFHMDAGTERILHDWTENAVADIGDTLYNYEELNAHILPYDEVASFYENQSETKPFTYFRSLIATWDNTARYGKDAYLVHGFTPQRFQEWLESTIEYSRRTLAEDRRYIVINAWNEWAEGAHLEPDEYFGYSYLNSIGRALSNQSYSLESTLVLDIPSSPNIELTLSPQAKESLKNDIILKRQFLSCVKNSTILSMAKLYSKDDIFTDTLSIELDSSTEYKLNFKDIALFDTNTIENMLREATRLKSSIIIPNYYTQESEPFSVTANGSVTNLALWRSPFALLPDESRVDEYKNIRVCSDSYAISAKPSRLTIDERDRVTTIMRLHSGADLSQFKRALYSLASMQECIVTPLITLQDLDQNQRDELEQMISAIPFADGVTPKIIDYSSMNIDGDLRTLMLNDALKQVETQYAAFLDYDDLLFGDAYSWLIERMLQSDKAVSFGRVYATTYDSKLKLITQRDNTFEYGYSYDDFLSDNHAPIHSFMLDLEKLNLSKVTYHQDQKYMEDYYLTLQLFTKDNCDWASLTQDRYIGDYIHSTDGEHTLAISDHSEKSKLLDDPLYLRDEQRIKELRDSIL